MAIVKEKVIEINHFTDRLFRFKTTRNPGTRFRDGEFLMIGLEIEGKPLLRAYSVASPNYERFMEWFSIKVPNGPLTSKLQLIKIGDEIITNTKAVGTLVLDNLKPGRNLYLLATGTGIAPFMSLIRGIETYDNYEKVILLWSTRFAKELGYNKYLEQLNHDRNLRDIIQNKFYYYPSVTREKWKNTGRISTVIYNGSIQTKLGIENFDKEKDRVMVCGSMPMNIEFKKYFTEKLGCKEGNSSIKGEIVFEKSFVEK